MVKNKGQSPRRRDKKAPEQATKPKEATENLAEEKGRPKVSKTDRIGHYDIDGVSLDREDGIVVGSAEVGAKPDLSASGA